MQEVDFKFCPVCGTLYTKNGVNPLVCLHCNNHYYINPRPTNAAIIRNDFGEVLFAVRAVAPKKGYLDFPGGFVNSDETFEQSLVRELKEELDIVPKTMSYLCSEHDLYPFKGLIYHTLCAVFVVTYEPAQKLHPADDVKEVRWISPEKVDHSQIAFGGITRALQKFVKLPPAKTHVACRAGET